MHPNELPTRQDIKQLLEKYAAATKSEISWAAHYPNYPDSVLALMQYITSSAWCNPNYPAGNMSEIFDRVDSASVIDVTSMLTAIARGERFVTGHWKASIESGQLKAVINRALQLLN